jgi:heme exporter protein D
MNWGSLSEFLAMGGYGLYVWGSFGMCALVVAGEVFGLAQRRRALRGLLLDGAEATERPLHEA